MPLKRFYAARRDNVAQAMRFGKVKRPAEREKAPKTRLEITGSMPERNAFQRKGMLAHRSLDGYSESFRFSGNLPKFYHSDFGVSRMQGTKDNSERL